MPEENINVISDEHYSALGKVAACWALFESGIDFQSWKMAGLPSDAGACFTAQIMGPAKKLDVLVSLLNLFEFSETATALNKMGDKIRGLGDERNRALHDMWLADEETGQPHRYEISARKTVKINTISVSTDQLLDLSVRILAQYDAFEAIMDGVVSPMRSSLERPQEG